MRDSLLMTLLTGCLLPALALAAPAPPGAERCLVAARIYLDGLVPAQRKRAVAPFDSEARRTPVFPPGAAPARSGLRTGEMVEGQRIRLHDFLSCGLSSQGYQKVLAVMRRADAARDMMAKVELPERETRAQIGSTFYWVTVFGDPSPDKPWGWRVEGHHLLLDFTVANGELELSPFYLGAEPAVVTGGNFAGYRVMDTEFARGLELLESLTPEQRARAVIGKTLPPDLFDTPDRRKTPLAPAGLPASSLDRDQRRLLDWLLDEYLGNAEPGTAERLRARIAAGGADALRFAWMGPTERGQPVYYRVQSPALVLEFLQAPDSSVAKGAPSVNHIHTWWRVLPAAGGAKG
jgi:hypothetical protein